MRSTRPRVLIGCLLAAGCGRALETGDTPSESAATIAVFQPNAANPCRSRLPFPTDLARNRATGTLDLPYCNTDTAEQIALKTGLRTLGGYSLQTPIYTTFADDLDAGSLAGNVYLYRNGAPDPVPAVAQWSASDKRVYVVPAAPLLEGSSYTVAIMTGVLDTAGEAVVSDQVFTFLKSRTPLVDFRNYSALPALDDQSAASLEPLRLGFAPMFNMLDSLGHDRQQVAVAWTFTTQLASSILTGLAAVIVDANDPKDPEDPNDPNDGATFFHYDTIAAADHPLVAAAGIPVDNLCDIHTGQVTFGSLLTEAGVLGPIPNEASADYLLTTPVDSNGTCATPWNQGRIVVFVHGLGRCKNDALAIANGLAGAGFATLSVDGPRAGGRSVGALGDQDLDGCADQPETPELIALGDASPNPFSIRDHLREWGLEVFQIADGAAAEPWTLVGEAAPIGAMPALVDVIGHSWGGIAAVLAGQVSDAIGAVAVTATTGALGLAFSPAIEAAIVEGLTVAQIDPSSALGQSILTDQLGQAVSAFTWALEPADPAFAARQYTAGSPPVLVQVVGTGDVDAPLHEMATQAVLAAAFGQDEGVATFTLACDGGAPLCDDPTAAVGSMLVPCVEDASDPRFLLAYQKTAAMQAQLISFVASGGACVGQLGATGCTPITDTNPTCP